MSPPKQTLEHSFEIDALYRLLQDGSLEVGDFTHYQIADWCLRMSNAYHDEDCSEDFDAALSVAASVECQWDLFLVNAFSTSELQALDFDAVRLPRDWFADWMRLMERAIGTLDGQSQAN